MITRSEKIKNRYDKLLLNSGQLGQRVHVRIDKSAPIKVFAACSFPHKKLILEIGPIRDSWLPKNFQKPSIKGLNVLLKPYAQLPKSDVTLLLELEQSDSIDIFSVFVARTCDELDKISDPQLAIRTVISLITKWKDFFSSSSYFLSPERQTGLYGELYLLQYFASEEICLGKTIASWTGSNKTNQDYEFGTIALEVKSSVAVDNSTINISNSRQLDDKGLDKLYLARLLFDVRQGETETLPKLIEAIKEIIQEKSPEYMLEFEEKLINAGYLKKHSELYNDRMYAIRNLTFYHIKNDFPRLLESNLPIGVAKVSYQIDLQVCNNFIVESSNVINELRTSCD